MGKLIIEVDGKMKGLQQGCNYNQGLRIVVKKICINYGDSLGEQENEGERTIRMRSRAMGYAMKNTH